MVEAVEARRAKQERAADSGTELDRRHPRHRRVVELRFFGGLTHRETAEVLGVSEQTVRLDWSMARAWLRERLSRENP